MKKAELVLSVLTGKEKETEVMRKKLFAILLALCMVLTMMPVVAWAENIDTYYYGTLNYRVGERKSSLNYRVGTRSRK